MGIEISHLVVEQEPRTRHHDLRAVPLFERVGDGDSHSILIHNRIVSGLFAFIWEAEIGGSRHTGNRFVDLPTQLRRIALAGETLDRHVHEIHVGQEKGTIAIC